MRNATPTALATILAFATVGIPAVATADDDIPVSRQVFEANNLRHEPAPPPIQIENATDRQREQVDRATDSSVSSTGTSGVPVTSERRSLIEFARLRFAQQGLEWPVAEFVFHADLEPCHLRKGLYLVSQRTLVMCSLDKATLLHELAHAWAHDNLSRIEIDEFVSLRGLASWNDHADEWKDRATEHVAETIAWALLERPRTVRWVETGSDGSIHATYRLLSIGVDRSTLTENFRILTGLEPVFRIDGEQPDPNVVESPGRPSEARFKR